MLNTLRPRAAGALAVVALSLFMLLMLPAYGVAEFEDPALMDMAPTALRLFGIEPPAHMDGKPLFEKTTEFDPSQALAARSGA